ncbi:MAG: 30S ribosomal protein S8 [Patescibacteria group bacterium]
MTDPIADLLTQIRNAHLAHRPEVVLPHSSLKEQILKILRDEGWISGYEKSQTEKFPQLVIVLKYDETGQPMIKHIKRISMPSRRVYVDRRRLPIVLNNFGMAVVSTSRGLMTNRDARKKHLGGEVLFEIY